MDTADAETLRRNLVAAYDETDALIRFLAGYEVIRKSDVMEGYELVCQKLETESARIGQMSAAELMMQSDNLPNMSNLIRLAEISRSIRNDAKVQKVLLKAERLSQSGALSKAASSARKKLNSPALIPPTPGFPPSCNWDDPSTYPSGADLAISNGVALALHALADALPGILGFFFTVPNAVRIALVIAAYAVDEVTNALAAVAADAAYCEAVRLLIEKNMTNDEGFMALLFTNDFYLGYLLNTVRSSLTKATNTGIPTNCGNARLTEALTYFDSSDAFTGTGPDRVTVYNKLRAAYQNIGASACVQ
ncbi:MAG: hypothetical protein JST85_24130 [Acidobacteria bacterium]|nr:hypothetical protein [Acidobacteriota bacterium]